MKQQICEDSMESEANEVPDKQHNPVRIIELSKNIRELSLSLEKEKLKSTQLSERLRILEAESHLNSKPDALKKQGSVPEKGQERLLLHLKSYQERLTKCEELVSTLRDKNSSLTRDVQIALKVLESETGESMNLNMWWNKLQSAERNQTSNGKITGGWRGRHQQIILLKERLKALESKLRLVSHVRHKLPTETDDNIAENFNGATNIDPTELLQTLSSIGSEAMKSELSSSTVNSGSRKNHSHVTQLEQENKELREEVSVMRTKLERIKARERNGITQLNDMRTKIERLLEKSKNDDELIQSLVEAQTGLKESVTEAREKLRVMEGEYKVRVETSASNEARMRAELQQLHTIAREKDEKIINLEKRLAISDGDRAKAEIAAENERQDGKSREVALLTIERDGLREMVSCLNQRIDRISEEHRALQRELKMMEKQPKRPVDPVTRRLTKPTHTEFNRTMTVEEWLEQFVESKSTENQQSADGRTRRDPVKAIRRAREEIVSLKAANQKLLEEKHEAFANFVRLADKMQMSDQASSEDVKQCGEAM